MKICKSIFSKARGLMFSNRKDLVFVFGKSRRISLHMFFVFFPIDVYFLDSDQKVIEIKENFKPFRLYKSKKKAKYAVEISTGKKYKLGQKIIFS